MSNVQVPIGLGGEPGDHLPPGGRQVLRQLLRRVGDAQEVPITEVDRGVDLVVVLRLGQEGVRVIHHDRLRKGENKG